MTSKIYVGLDIGTSKICVVVGEASADGSINILGIGDVPSRGVRKGQPVDFKTLQKCIHDAIVEAEDRSDVTIEVAVLAVTGAHVESFNHRGSLPIHSDQDEVTWQDIEEVEERSKDVKIPQQNIHFHSIIRKYFLDEQEYLDVPVGLSGEILEAEYHIIHGRQNYIKNLIRCVGDVSLNVDDVVFSPIASAQICLNPTHKKDGSLLIDIGGGTSDFVLYEKSCVSISGSVPLGGDHITQDIAQVFKIPSSRANRLKEEAACAWIEGHPGGTIVLDDDPQFAGKEIDRRTLDEVVHYRILEILEIIQERCAKEGHLDRISGVVYLTGGTSLLKGIDDVATQVFALPIETCTEIQANGLARLQDNPQYSTGIGLIRYMYIIDSKRPASSPLGKLRDAIGGLFRATK